MINGAKEPKARPTEHDKHSNVVAIRNPNLLTKAPMAGPRNKLTPITMEVTHAARTIGTFVVIFTDIMR